jgi:hypothetical protein
MLQMMNSGLKINFKDHKFKDMMNGILEQSKWQVSCGIIEFLASPLEFYWANMWMGKKYPIVWELQSKVMFWRNLICHGENLSMGIQNITLCLSTS